MLGYQQPSSPVIIINVVVTLEWKRRWKSKLFKMFKRADLKAVRWQAAAWADDDVDGGDKDGSALPTDREQSQQPLKQIMILQKQLRCESRKEIFPLKS